MCTDRHETGCDGQYSHISSDNEDYVAGKPGLERPELPGSDDRETPGSAAFGIQEHISLR